MEGGIDGVWRKTRPAAEQANPTWPRGGTVLAAVNDTPPAAVAFGLIDTGGEFAVRSVFLRNTSGSWLDSGLPGPHSLLFASRGRCSSEFATSIRVRENHPQGRAPESGKLCTLFCKQHKDATEPINDMTASDDYLHAVTGTFR